MEKYFISKGHMYEFALYELNGKARMKLLGINMGHFVNPSKAKEWHDSVLVELEQAGLDSVTTIEILEMLYNEMK